MSRLVSSGTAMQNFSTSWIVNRKGFAGFGINPFPVDKQPAAGGHKVANLRIGLFKCCGRHVQSPDYRCKSEATTRGGLSRKRFPRAAYSSESVCSNPRI